MRKHRPIQTGKPHYCILPQPRRHRSHEAPRDHRVHAKETQFQSAVLKPHHLSPHAIVDCWGAGGQGGWEGGGQEEEAAVEDGELGGGGEGGDEGGLGGYWVSISVWGMRGL